MKAAWVHLQAGPTPALPFRGAPPLLAGAYCLAAAMALLAVGLSTHHAHRAGADVPRWRDVIGVLGALAAVAVPNLA